MALICCDTSFLFALYGKDSLSRLAMTEARGLQEAISVSILNEFELENAIHLSFFRKAIDSSVATAIFANYAADKSRGKVVLVNCDLMEVLAEAKRLSLAHSQSGGHRAFDILHVAAALQLGAREFLSFDGNQRRLAKAEGLKVRPG
jgi:predicted nucleic acid-binding protein